METQVRLHFEAEGISISEEVAQRCAKLCRSFGLSVEDFGYKWSAYSVNASISEKDISLQHLDSLWKECERQDKQSRKLVVEAPVDQGVFTKDNIDSMMDDFLDGPSTKAIKMHAKATPRKTFQTPQRRIAQSPAISPSVLASPLETPGGSMRDYTARSNAGHIEITFNPQGREDLGGKRGPRHPVDLAVFDSCVAKEYRYMAEKIIDCSESLDLRIDEFAEKIVKRHGLLADEKDKAEGAEEASGPKALSHVGLPAQEEIVVAGRVCVDGVGLDLKLNEASLLLEGSTTTSGGARVRLNLSETPLYSLFPGQIIAAVGTNRTGTLFVPTVVYQGSAAPVKKSTPQDLMTHYFRDDGQDVKSLDMMIAAGPFTLNTAIDYKPLDDLLDVVQRTNPDILILCGPFVDMDHPLLQAGDLNMTYAQLFESIMHRVTTVATASGTQVITVPSLKDLHHHAVFPQPPFPTAQDQETVRSFSNPCTFTAREIAIGVCTADILFELGKQEISAGHRGDGTGDRMSRLANHLLEQRCYYPLYPPGRGVNIDLTSIDKLDLPNSPDILILPSELRFFIKNVNNTLVINPGRLTRHATGGTFARVSVHAPRRNDIPEGTKKIPHGVPDRSLAQIVRI
eukprot:m.8276 g.8276  ORF g.8276 m.8276 type:complete len:627 (-) comp5197_c0_seq1:26-1906(-)